MNRDLRSDWVWSVLADIGAKLAPSITVLTYYTTLGSAQGSQIVVAYSYTMVAWIFIDLGLGLYGAREIAREDADVDRLHVEITFARLCLAVPIGLALVFVLTHILDITTLEPFGFAIFLVARSLATEWRLRGEGRFKALSHVTQIALIGQLVGLGAVFLLGLSESFLSLPFALWAVLLAVLSWRAAGVRWARLRGGFTGAGFKHLLVSYQLSLVNGVSTIAQQLPIIALSLVYPVASFAGFALLHRLTLSATMIFVSLGSAVFPRFVRAAASDPAQAWRESLRLMGIIGLTCLPLIALIVLVVQVPIIQTTFFPSVGLGSLLIMMAYLLLRSLRISPMRLLIAGSQQRLALRASIAAAALLVVMLGVGFLCDSLTVQYAALAFMLAEIVMLGGMIYLVRGDFGGRA